MNPSHTITPRPETEITEDITRDNHDEQLLEDDDATPVVTPSQDTPTQHTNNNTTQTGITTPPMQTKLNASIPDEIPPPMFRQALENAPNPSRFLQTPQQESADNLSY